MLEALLYPWVKALHVAAAITFVGGVLATAMLLSLLCRLPSLSSGERNLAVGLHRWQRLVTTPAMLAVWALGSWMALQDGWFAYPWLQAKLVLVLILSAFHGVQSGVLRRMASGAVLRQHRMDGGVPLTIGLVTGIAIPVIAIH